nr:hypothetical protein BdHM001_05300 [Bdellovibrio sp. HM001]
MKILVLQLARLGDIYMTWPALQGLRRMYPKAEIHLLTRPRFEGALVGLQAVDRHWSLPSSEILTPLVQAEPDIEASLQEMDRFVSELKSEGFDRIINFTFSPFSSYLTHAVSELHTEVQGYTRFKDGSLCLADEVSAYFYAQVGLDKPNRVHVADVMASMIELQYTEADWSIAEIPECKLTLPERYLVLHVGASDANKALSAGAWVRALRQLARQFTELPVVLIGSAGEAPVALQIEAEVKELQFVNLAGRTQMSDLFAILKNAELLIGCDSAPIHVASLTDTPTLNVSVGPVNFWETGPKASLGFIYRAEDQGTLVPEQVGAAIANLLAGHVDPGLIVRSGGLVSYAREEAAAERFQWDLVQALYLGGEFPVAERMEIVQGAMKLNDINNFAMEQLGLLPTLGVEKVAPFLDSAEEVISNISRMVPELSPLVSWYHAERIRIAPGTLEEIRTATLNVHERLKRHLHVYIPHEALKEEVGNGAL